MFGGVVRAWSNHKMRSYYNTTDRYICSVLEEMRTLHKTRNYAMLPSLIEEAQMLANRMEAGLENKRTYEEMRADIAEAKAELEKLKAAKVAAGVVDEN